ncbi:MAG: fibronectin type III domain-containing protein [Nitrospirae bacterium]|nr:fibronectin type III domain-containing protein [Nitrospirota bacterium]
MKKTSFAVLTVLLSILLVSCGNLASSPEKSHVTLRSAAPLHGAVSDATHSAADVTRVRVAVTGIGMDEMIVSADYASSGFEIKLDVPNGIHRHFKVDGLDASGNVIYSGSTNADLAGEPVTLSVDMYRVDAYPPVFDGVATALAVSSTEIQLSWNAASDDMTTQVNIVYLVFKATASGGQNYAEPEYTTEPGVTSFAVTGLTDGATYYFVVRAKDADGRTDTNTKEVSAVTPVLRWSKTYGALITAETIFSVRATSDGGLVSVGLTESMNDAPPKPYPRAVAVPVGIGTIDALVIKTDSFGAIEWQKQLGGRAGNDMLYSIEQTADGGYILAGETASTGSGMADGWVVKLKPDGALDWQHTFGGIKDDSLSSIKPVADDGYIALGVTSSFGGGNEDLWLLRLENNGDVRWQKSAGDWGNDKAYSVITTSDGGFLAAGSTDSYGEGADADGLLVKFDASGIAMWHKVLGGWGSDEFMSVVELDNGDVVAVGDSDTFGNESRDLWVAHLSSAGNLDWATVIGGTGNDYGYGIVSSGDGGVVIAGESPEAATGGWLLKLDNAGGVVWQRSFSMGLKDSLIAVISNPAGGYIAAGTAASASIGSIPDMDGWIMQVDTDGNFGGLCVANVDTLAKVVSTEANILTAASITITTIDIKDLMQTGDGSAPIDSSLVITGACSESVSD